MLTMHCWLDGPADQQQEALEGGKKGTNIKAAAQV